MPYPNEHAARQKAPDKFRRFARKHPEGFPEGVDVIYGVRDDGKTEVQSVRFTAPTWTPAKARAWLKEHGFLAGTLEEATEKAEAPAPAEAPPTVDGGWLVGLPLGLLAEDNAEWDAATAQAGVLALPPEKAAQAFLLVDTKAPTDQQSRYRLPVAREQGGNLVVNLHGLRAAVSRVAAMNDVPEQVRQAAQKQADSYLMGAAPTEKEASQVPGGGVLAVTKVEPDQQLVYGWLYVCADKDGTPVVDHSGETVQITELEKAAVSYALTSRRAGETHQRIGVGRLVSSVVFTPELKKALGIPPGVLPDGWFVGYKIDDPGTWARVKKGELRMLSIGGRAERRVVA